MIVDLALSVTGSQLIASVLPTVSLLLLLLLCLRSSLLRTCIRPIKNKGLYFTSVFEDISSHSEDAKLVLKLFGYCMSSHLLFAYNLLKIVAVIGW